MKKQLLFVLLMMLPMVTNAHDIEVQNGDGVTIYYNYINNSKELAVTYRGDSYISYPGEYTGNIVIPEEVNYMNRTRKVTSIGERAFFGCSSLTSVTIPNSVTSIASRAFENCSKLSKVIVSDIGAWCGINFNDYWANPLYYAKHLFSDENTEIKDLVVPDNVTSIGNYAFQNCSGLTSVTIPNSVKSIGDFAFYDCNGLTSITIGNSVTSIGNYAFKGCSGITSVTIPNSVNSIGDYAFYKCSGLTSVTIGNSVTSIGDGAFESCSGLTSVTIPNSVNSIGDYAFEDCSGLTSVTIGNSVKTIATHAFDGCDIPTVISLIKNPFKIEGKTSSSRAFSLNTYNNATLYVPKGTIEKYNTTNGWKDFVFIEEGVPARINVVENKNNNKTTIYNLNGVRQDEPQKGINIVNGKKVVVK